MNWHINQEVVCIKTHSQGKVIEGKVYTIQGIKTAPCGCKEVLLDIGAICKHPSGLFRFECADCGWVGPAIADPTAWVSEELFAPLEYDKEAIEELISQINTLS